MTHGHQWSPGILEHDGKKGEWMALCGFKKFDVPQELDDEHPISKNLVGVLQINRKNLPANWSFKL